MGDGWLSEAAQGHRRADRCPHACQLQAAAHRPLSSPTSPYRRPPTWRDIPADAGTRVGQRQLLLVLLPPLKVPVADAAVVGGQQVAAAVVPQALHLRGGGMCTAGSAGADTVIYVRQMQQQECRQGCSSNCSRMAVLPPLRRRRACLTVLSRGPSTRLAGGCCGLLPSV
jgi:hypothetical protein